ncbi:uncharacterized protein EV420DRAFT_1483085 [Desarmillaria tabescens]|uniref:Uncharacterized protein n=1 Tax=Armillaria tabescens TaxID=1929756 RepID=A0AA39JV70_ARMTA|nr:uncharacterized protein EV420DRAFT_1483085 [Desarmillaria tabescens]KAK0449545.1 hypothetical protein EV420DRAFT_1483085 [Desarmillaria tabescens]
MSQNYTAQSAETGYYITSTNSDVPGQTVATADGNGGIPEGATLTFSKVVQSPSTVNVTIKGINGLYFPSTLRSSTLSNLGYKQNAASGSELIWSSEPVNWQVDVAPASTEFYEIIPASGQDLFWVTGVQIGPIVQVRSGADIQRKENQWTLNKVD